ncbi:alpha/beta-hydrolase [Dendrothele bispora CBS 962.96]|uniref:Alpha/beta-hydrolase n=1 Tax=Dendrothele bispora (strain CBS 962.96) TaxID=1314807 RepID=A0A4S8MXA7_DENBC|nr:alpha/beta-hydrolase [Dendrothele bispora CBS 962.96]
MLITLAAVAALFSSAYTLRGTAHYREYFYVGSTYVPKNDNTSIAHGQVYVEHLTPALGTSQPYPILFVHGAGMTGTNFLNTPDGRPGWADWFLSQGYEVYLIDQPARGRSAWQQSVDGPQITVDSLTISQIFTATAEFNLWPNATLHTQWPGNGTVGDPIFDQFFASTMPLLAIDSESGEKNQHALAALLDRIGEVVLITHSQSGLFGWPLADARPSLVKAIVTMEPGGPPFIGDTLSPNTPMHPYGLSEVPITYDPPITDPSEIQTVNDTEGRLPGYTCILQKEPARQWPNLLHIPVLTLTSESSWHGIFDDCTVDFLRQAGLTVDFVRLQDVGIHGNGHMMFMELNSDEIVKKVVGKWIAEKISLSEVQGNICSYGIAKQLVPNSQG